jgi:hypothetical protein
MAGTVHQTKTRQPLEQEEAKMSYENYILEAIEMIETWELPEEELAGAIQAQAELMAGTVQHWRDS